MKILFFISSLQCGGAEHVAATLCNRWASTGQDVTLATFDDGSAPPFFPLDERVRHLPLGLRKASTGLLDASLANLRRAPQITRAIEEVGPDRIVSFIEATNVLVLLAARRTAIPVVVAERIDPARHRLRAPWRILRRLTYGRAARIVVQTDAAAGFFPAAWRSRIAVIPNPVPEPHDRSHVAGDGNRLVAMGRLEPQKGFDLLIRAFATIAEDRPSWTLTIYGEGQERVALADAIEDGALVGRVVLAGRAADAAEAFRRADLFVLSSRYEGFPNALCEAMAAGVPAVAFDCRSGPREIVRDGVDGILVPDGDVSALAAGLLRLTGDDDLRRMLGARAAEITERFSVDRIAVLWIDLLRGIA